MQQPASETPCEDQHGVTSTRLGLIARISSAVVGSATLSEIGRLATENITDAFRIDSCVIRILEGDELVLLASTGVPEAKLPPRMKANQGIGDQILKNRHPLVINDTAKHSATAHAIEKDGTNPKAYIFKSFAGAPMLVGEEVIGILGIYDRQRCRTFSAEDLEHLQIVANHIGVAIVNDRLYKEVQRQKNELESQVVERMRIEQRVQRQLNQIAALRTVDVAIAASLDHQVTLNVVLEQVAAQLNVDAACILLLDSRSQILEFGAGRGFRTEALRRTRLRVGEGFAGRAARSRVHIHLPDVREATADFYRSPLLAEEEFVGYYAVPLIARGHVEGVLEMFQRTPLNPDQEWLEFLNALAGQAAIAIDNAALFDELERSNVELILAYDTTLEGWSGALDLRDRETEGHTQRVTELTLRLARYIGISGDEMVHLRRGALLHDIGKMGIPDAILHKPGPLSDEEWLVMRKHPGYAHELLASITFLKAALDIPYCHHEKWDGSGYPRGLKRDEIPIAARIFAIVDVWDALRSDRPYRKAWPEVQVREYIATLAGSHFDPTVVDAFFGMITDGSGMQGVA